MGGLRGLIFDIQRFALHDGPGIRTLVFLKGCPLSCRWCCNPESQAAVPQIGYQPASCISCDACIAACPFHAITVDGGERVFDLDLCAGCRDLPCADACPTRAIERFGREMTVEEVLREVRRDELFYRNSGGGVTVSGGEPLRQADFVRELFSGCRSSGIGTAVETTGFCAWEDLEKILDVTDLFLYDIKHIDPARHRAFTGTDNTLIMENLKRLRTRTANIVARVPVVPGFNDDDRSIDAIAAFAQELGIGDLHLLPYHRLGRSKYDRLSREYRADDVPLPSEDRMSVLRQRVQERNVRVQIGG